MDDETTEMVNEKILEIMEKAHSIPILIFGKSLNDFNLHYDFITCIPNNEIETAFKDWLAEKNLNYITEFVSNTVMTLNDKITKIGNELLKAGSEGNTLIIVDRFIFPKKHDTDYKNLFCGVVNYSKASNLTIVTDPNTVNQILLIDIKKELHVKIQIKYQANLHDRWWIVGEEKKGLLFGTSLNGFGKDKLSTISPLLDYADILKILKNI